MTTEFELLERANALSGLSLLQLSNKLLITLPPDLKRSKGWIGQTIETFLGASAGCAQGPDFPNLGIELKTLPLDISGKPKETTFITTIDLMTIHTQTWETSYVKQKLSKVLWVPLEADPNLPLSDRRIGSAFFWSPTEAEENVLKKDWEELTDLIALGKLDSITSRLGVALQIRPKAADGQALTQAINEKGEKSWSLPRGFYLRTQFTQQLLQRNQSAVNAY